MAILKILLLPFALLYNLITSVRNRLYDLGIKPSVKFEVPVLGVGNLSVGGTGKTPMVEHLIRLLSSQYKIATLSRGYGRKTKGMRIASALDDASTLGDEPFQFYNKFKNQILVTVGEDRVYAIPNILHQFPQTQVILLDDAYQHRRVNPMMNILLTDYSRPFYNDVLLPAGRLRENRLGAVRADVIVVTKCPSELSDDGMMVMEGNIRKYASKPIFFTKIRYGSPLAFGSNSILPPEHVVLVSGIANHKLLEDYVSYNFKMKHHIIHTDHYEYTLKDMEALLNIVRIYPDSCVLTTEKDMVKMASSAFTSITSQIPFFYLPIEIDFLKNGKDFDEMVQTRIKHAIDN